jgi:hypothetical protein
MVKASKPMASIRSARARRRNVVQNPDGGDSRPRLREQPTTTDREPTD